MYDVKAEALPKTHRSLVCAHDGIELHGSKTLVSGPFERMRAHDAGNPLAPWPRGRSWG